MGYFLTYVGDAVGDAYDTVKGEIVNVVGGVGDYIVDSTSDIVTGAGEVIEDIGENISTGFIEAPIEAITDPLGNLGKDLTIPLLIGAAFLLLKK